jgi:hypothetical protein
MIAKKTDFTEIDKEKYLVYIKKADDFHTAMTKEFEDKNWHAVGLTAVHCAISITDALIIYKAGVRSSATDHREAAKLLKQRVNAPEVSKYADLLVKIIGAKNRVEYEDRLLMEQEAVELFKRTQRYFDWAKSLIR